MRSFRGLLLLSALGAAQQLFEQNCAAKKRCNRPLELRDASVNAPPAGREVPSGHLKPLGHSAFSSSWAGEIDVVQGDISPAVFWTKYWPKRPVLLKGFGKGSPAFQLWRNDSYLVEKFGDFKVKCEPKNEDRLTDYCGQVRFGQEIRCPTDTIPYRETFLKLKKVIPRLGDDVFDKYVVSQMPDAMGEDVLVPHAIACGQRDPEDPGPETGGPWMTQLYENNFWFSKNEGQNFSSSVIHYDMNHQLMCLFDGTKEWIMWNLQEEGDKIPLWSRLYEKASHTALGSDDSPVDAERVDLLRWPAFARARWQNTTMEAGDCLYLPPLLLHYVRSYGRNVAAMTMFQQSERFNQSCVSSLPEAHRSLSAYDVLWSFPEEDPSLLGWDMIKMGFPNWKANFLQPLVRAARASKTGKLTKKRFMKAVAQLLQTVAEEDHSSLSKRALELYSTLETSSGGGVGPVQLFRSRELRFFLKDLVVLQDERHEQGVDTEAVQYDLVGNVVRQHVDL